MHVIGIGLASADDNHEPRNLATVCGGDRKMTSTKRSFDSSSVLRPKLARHMRS
jgi:hypothetical protein